LLRANVGAVFNRIKDARAEEKKNRNEGCQHKAGRNGVIGAASPYGHNGPKSSGAETWNKKPKTLSDSP
jgi:hypothetical protein